MLGSAENFMEIGKLIFALHSPFDFPFPGVESWGGQVGGVCVWSLKSHKLKFTWSLEVEMELDKGKLRLVAFQPSFDYLNLASANIGPSFGALNFPAANMEDF